MSWETKLNPLLWVTFGIILLKLPILKVWTSALQELRKNEYNEVNFFPQGKLQTFQQSKENINNLWAATTNTTATGANKTKK